MSATTAAPRVAIQGERGAYSEEAAVKLYGGAVEIVPRPTFEALFAAVDEGAADGALAPIENSLAGSVQRSYDLLLEHRLHIAAEVVIPVRHQLIGCPGATLDTVETVESHTVALAQCERFFAAHARLRRVVSDDTAGSVARIVKAGDRTRAAIAGVRAAEVYGGTILREHLEDDPENYTRFVLLTAHAAAPDGADKLSLVFRLPRSPGALHHALEPFARRRLDLLKIESRPVKGRPWDYHFFLDLRASTREAETRSAIDELRARASEVRLLGCYVSADTRAAPADALEIADTHTH